MNTPDHSLNEMEISSTEVTSGPMVAIPTMKSLFIEMYFGETLLSSGTSFLAANDQQSHCALITNRHNVTGRRQDTGACLSKTAAIPDNIVIYFHKNGERTDEWIPIKLPLYRTDGSPYWIEHPRLGCKADVVALNLSWGNDVWKMPYYMKTKHDRSNILVGPAEPISVIGFPFGLSSFGKFPIWATGFLAQEIDLITPDNPVFLIDCRSRQGQSGSPVIAHRPSGARRKEGNRTIATLSPENTWEFLGIYSGRVNQESDLGMVWHVTVVEELLEGAEAEMLRRKKVHTASEAPDQE
ncbi:hypothetical protein [Comamonas terrigena]|uniref:hypothetical protein n=1 Tax=Comamonas terrigena TaxID=32013 RepID=UPI0028A9EAFA|nr:hypothetical protein [Comamonas terrigena]